MDTPVIIIRWLLSHLLLIVSFLIVIYLLIFKSELFQPGQVENPQLVQGAEKLQAQTSTDETPDNAEQDTALVLKEAQTAIDKTKLDIAENKIRPAVTRNSASKNAGRATVSNDFKEDSADTNKTIEERYTDFFSKLNPALFQPVQPQIETAEQYKLLTSARQAFDDGDYVYAEALYKQLVAQLPDVPDVLAELANLYKIQGKMNNYIEINEQLIGKLVNHNRFEEAWSVARASEKINVDSAYRQIMIIESRIKKN